MKPLFVLALTNRDSVTRCSGTPGFASPEAISSKKNLFDRSSDVFSLACIVVQMITGKPPYQDEADEKECDVLLVIHRCTLQRPRRAQLALPLILPLSADALPEGSTQVLAHGQEQP